MMRLSSISLLLLVGCEPGTVTVGGLGGDEAGDPVDLSCTGTEERDIACGLNSRGTQHQNCVNDVWTDSGTCTDPDVCVDDETQAGSTACGLNDRGVFDEVCVSGQWQDSSTCVDPDVCTDTDTQAGSTACGLNGRGVYEQQCVSGQWQDTGTCVDPDDCVDGNTQINVSCGLNDRGTVDQTCVVGEWQDDADCVDPDDCVDDTSRPGTTPCGLNDRGTYVQDCNAGTWEDDTSDCDDPDECVDTATQVGTTPCDLFGPDTGELVQDCVTGQWQDSSTCGYDGPTGCSDCHDSGGGSAPWAGLDDVSDTTDNAVGAHSVHVFGGSIVGKGFPCSACHVVPSAWDDDGHILNDSDPGVELFPGGAGFAGLAAGNGSDRFASPSYDESTGTCTNIYCHAGGDNLSDDTSDNTSGVTIVRSLVWTAAGTGVITCGTTPGSEGGSCHGLEPVGTGSRHDGRDDPLTNCDNCHSGTVQDDGGSSTELVVPATTHINGDTPS